MTIEKKYWSVLTEGQQKKFEEMNDEGRNAWWHENAKEIKKKVPTEETTSEKPSDGTTDNPSDKPTKKVNWRQKPVTNNRFRMAKSAGGSCMVIDGGADFTTLGMNWLITYRFEHGGFAMRGPMELGDHVVAMDKSQGLTKARSTNGPVLLRAAQSIRVKQGVTPPRGVTN